VEQLASLRSMPNLSVIRPADGNELVASWKLAVSSTKRPTVLVLSRQNLPVLEGTKELANEAVAKGAYVISQAKGEESGILIATGSEVKLAIDAQAQLADRGIHVRVVSMPSMDLFDQQDAAYKESILPASLTKRVAVEAGASFGWGKYIGLNGASVTLDTWGASAPGEQVFEKLGFTVENVVKAFETL